MQTHISATPTTPAYTFNGSHQDSHGGGWGNYGQNFGISDKDQSNFSTHDLSRQVGALESGLLSAVYEKSFDVSVAVEKNGAAGQLATNVQGAAINLAVVTAAKDGLIEAGKNSHAALLLASQNNAASLAAMAECCCKILEKVAAEACATRELVREEASKTRDYLSTEKTADLRAELVRLQTIAAIGGPGGVR